MGLVLEAPDGYPYVPLGLNAMLSSRPGDQWATEEVKKQVDRIKELKGEAQRLLERLQ